MGRHNQTTLQKNTQKITTRPGVYLYYDINRNVIYVGKAKNLKNRVRQYFAKDDALGAKTSLLVSQIARVQTIPTDSEFEAILLEASLIRKYLPKYNTAARDDKSPLYIVITLDEPFPRILFTRKRALEQRQRTVFGPFQSGRIARDLMRTVRHVIPYCTQKQQTGTPCFYAHIGLCNPCPSAIKGRHLARIYQNNLRRIALLLSGQARHVRMQLEHAMHKAADRLAFEEARAYKRQLDALDTLLVRAFDPSVYADRTDERLTGLRHVLHLSSLERIECLDVSMFTGAWATGSLVVFTNGLPDTDEYRRFRIKMSGKPNDVGMIAEVVRRRFRHPEWPLPNLLIVDGGKGQVKAVQQALSFTKIPIIGLAKRFEEIVVPIGEGFRVIRLARASPALHLVEHIRDEAHRFAKRYHTVLRSHYP